MDDLNLIQFYLQKYQDEASYQPQPDDVYLPEPDDLMIEDTPANDLADYYTGGLMLGAMKSSLFDPDYQNYPDDDLFDSYDGLFKKKRGISKRHLSSVARSGRMPFPISKYEPSYYSLRSYYRYPYYRIRGRRY